MLLGGDTDPDKVKISEGDIARVAQLYPRADVWAMRGSRAVRGRHRRVQRSGGEIVGRRSMLTDLDEWEGTVGGSGQASLEW